jgi:hypothetical protein
MLWSQMHGDEPTATAALFDVFDYFSATAAIRSSQRILSVADAVLRPDAESRRRERFPARNAQGIDVNRDALSLQTPKGSSSSP